MTASEEDVEEGGGDRDAGSGDREGDGGVGTVHDVVGGDRMEKELPEGLWRSL